MAMLLIYLHYALKYPQIYIPFLVKILRIQLLLLYSVLFFPFSDTLLSAFNCEADGYHYLLRQL